MNPAIPSKNFTPSKLADLLQKMSHTSHQIIAEEINYANALQNRLSIEEIEIIEDKIKSLKRKLLLFTQVAKILGNKS